MRAASRALLSLVVALGVAGVVAPTTPAAAQPMTATGPRCPAVVAGQPLSVSVPFSGTARPRADDEGRIESTSLHCAYGEGAAPAAEVTVTWAAGPTPCATSEVAVAPSLDATPFDQLADGLAGAAGTTCAASAAASWPWPVVAGGLVVGAGLGALALRRRRAARTAAPAMREPDPTPPVADPPAPAGAIPVLPVLPAPDGAPVLVALRGPGGRDFAHTGAGQLAVLAAVAYGSGDSITGDLARAGSLAGLPVRLRPRPELADLAWSAAHQDGALGR